jgi:hypothetical protein
MTSLEFQQIVCCNDLRFHVQQKLWPISIAQHRSARRGACSAACVFYVVLFFRPFSDLGTLKPMKRCLHRDAAIFSAFRLIGLKFLLHIKTTVFAADGTLHM